MNFSIGDTVVVIDDVIKGVVTEIYHHKIIIEDKDGFSFEFSPKELVIVHNDQGEMSKFSDIHNEDLMDKIHEKPKKKYAVKKVLKVEKQPPMEVDLHIHHLVATTKGMDNFDMLNLQIDTAKQKLEFAIRNRIPKVVFIHGVGEGVLKTELEFLFKKYHVEWYAASFKKYGLGATEVYIYQNPKG